MELNEKAEESRADVEVPPSPFQGATGSVRKAGSQGDVDGIASLDDDHELSNITSLTRSVTFEVNHILAI